MKIAVIMPIFNPNTQWLRDAVLSVKNTRPDGYFISINIGFDKINKWENNRKEEALQICKDMSDPPYFEVLPVITTINGPSDVCNLLLYSLRFKGFNYIARLDCDDLFKPGKLQAQVRQIEISNTDFCGAWGEKINESGNLINQNWEYSRLSSDHEQIKEYLLHRGNCLIHSSMIFKGELLDKGHLFYNPLCDGFEDYELYMRLVAQGYKATVCPQVLIQYRVHNNQYTKTPESQTRCNRLIQTTRNFYQAF